MPSTIFEVWQSGIITEEQYNTLLENGAFPNTIWTPGALDLPTTTSDMVAVKTIGLTGTKRQSIVVDNTGSVNSLNVLIEFYINDILAAKFEDTIDPDDEPYWLDMEYAFTTAVISVQDTISGQHTTYEIGVTAV